jgi:catechol 2,3-dioxygenase-like lactoylglutathione lyase family enzyme
MSDDPGSPAPRPNHAAGPAVSVVRVDHLVLSVADVERSLRFYVDELGLQPERVDEWRREEVFFPSVRIDENTIIDLFGLPPAGAGDAPAVSRNVDHICLVVEQTDLAELAASGRFEVVDGPDRRWGARGDGTSLYIRDPDHNVVELRYYD